MTRGKAWKRIFWSLLILAVVINVLPYLLLRHALGGVDLSESAKRA